MCKAHWWRRLRVLQELAGGAREEARPGWASASQGTCSLKVGPEGWAELGQQGVITEGFSFLWGVRGEPSWRQVWEEWRKFYLFASLIFLKWYFVEYLIQSPGSVIYTHTHTLTSLTSTPALFISSLLPHRSNHVHNFAIQSFLNANTSKFK